MNDEELFEKTNVDITRPKLCTSPLSVRLSYVKFPEYLNHYTMQLGDLIGLPNNAEVIRLLILWTFGDSDYFSVYRVENTFNISFYLSRLDPYIFEPIEDNQIVNLVDGDGEEEGSVTEEVVP